VGNGAVKPEVGKLGALREFSRPTSKKQVCGFLGLNRYYRKFVSNYASLALSLTDLTRKNAPNQFKWTECCESTFQQLKQLLCQTPVLWAPVFTREFVFQTDISEWGVGAVLMIWGLTSKKLLPHEN